MYYRKKIALGESDFKSIIDNNEYFVDKTLLIKEILEDSAPAILISRSRRFGKTLNLSMIRYFVERSLSYFDISGKEPERVYHSFVLGMLVSLNNTHEVLSNRESGYGRYDVMIIPKDKSKIGIIIEFKKSRVTNKKPVEQLIEEAKIQIEEKKYEAELLNRGITNIKKLVIVFKGKEVWVRDTTES